MFIAISDFWVNIAQAVEQLWNSVSGADWVDISAQIKNWLLSASGLAALGLFLKFGVPYFKSNKQLSILGTLIQRVAASEKESQTVGNILIDYVSLQSEVNVTSKTLTTDQKDKFTILATSLKAMKEERLQTIGKDIEDMVEDNVITIEEGIELAKNIPVVEQALGTNINDIIGK